MDDEVKKGARFEKAGDSFSAAEAYARALRLEPGNVKARKGLGRVAEDAIATKIAAALELERSMKPAEALEQLKRTKNLGDRVLSAGIELDAELDVAGTLERVVDRWVVLLSEEARRAQDEELWSAAVAHLRQIEILRPDYEDARDRLAEVWISWGKMDVAHGRYRSAAERFMEASRVPGKSRTAGSRQAAAIFSRLGLSALDKGACRSAVNDLRIAGGMVSDAVDPEILKRAESCALTCLSVDVIAAEDAGVDASRVDRLGVEIRGQISAGASEFLRVRDPATAAGDLCGSGTTRGPKEQPTTSGPRRFRSVVNLTAFTVLRSPAISQIQQLSTQQGAERESVVAYRQYEEILSGALSGSITLADRGTGRVSPAMPIRVEGETTAQWVRSPVSVVSTDDRSPTGQKTTGALIDARLQSRTRVEDQRRDARSRLLASLIEKFSGEVARILLSTVDTEPAVADPSEIDVSCVAIDQASGHAEN